MEKWYTVGTIVNTHGIRGELKVLPSSDFIEQRFKKGNALRAQHPDLASTTELTVERFRDQKTNLIVKFAGIEEINQALQYKGWKLQVSESKLGHLSDGEYYIHQIIGCDVYLPDGTLLGSISNVLQPGANDVWEVLAAGEKAGRSAKTYYIPYIGEVVKWIDIQQKRISIEPMEGLLD